ncbi:MAG: hypothetical protein HN732_27250 [Rhodospirillaceae bacterium]|nr:hypothetical protein [Rhodospirillaceae bacterium]
MLGRIGQAAMMPTLLVTAVATLKPEMLSQGAGALNFMRNLGGAVGINVIAVLLGQRTAFFSDAFAGLQTPDNSATQQFMSQFGYLLGQLGWSFEMMKSGLLYLVGRSVYIQASMMAFKDLFLFVAVCFFLAVIPALLMRDRRPKPKSRPVLAARTS